MYDKAELDALRAVLEEEDRERRNRHAGHGLGHVATVGSALVDVEPYLLHGDTAAEQATLWI